MRPIVYSFALLLAVAGCGGAKKGADSPANTDDTSGDGGGATADVPASTDSTPTSSTAAPGDDKSKKATPCGGFEIPDLLSVLSQAACEVQNVNSADQPDLKDRLEIKVVPDSPRIAPGSTASVTI